MSSVSVESPRALIRAYPIKTITLAECLCVHDPPCVIAEPRAAIDREHLLVDPERRRRLPNVVYRRKTYNDAETESALS